MIWDWVGEAGGRLGGEDEAGGRLGGEDEAGERSQPPEGSGTEKSGSWVLLVRRAWVSGWVASGLLFVAAGGEEVGDSRFETGSSSDQPSSGGGTLKSMYCVGSTKTAWARVARAVCSGEDRD